MKMEKRRIYKTSILKQKLSLLQDIFKEVVKGQDWWAVVGFIQISNELKRINSLPTKVKAFKSSDTYKRRLSKSVTEFKRMVSDSKDDLKKYGAYYKGHYVDPDWVKAREKDLHVLEKEAKRLKL